ncbi:MAG: DUF1848 domain-containing protein [Alphaproteobacteria bacterium]|nr:DUF1848 domain-containing protein [Alphaproteobacteria bacterium]
MIVSASYRTDIPAFYGDWFRRRLQAGFAQVANPYGGPSYRVPLDAGQATAFVFWTRNVLPFLPVLRQLAAADRPFVVQYTATGYPRALEERVPDMAQAVAGIRAVAEQFGRNVAVWRYDPILLSDLTPAEFHRRRFAELAAALQGSVNEVVASYLSPYRKTTRNLAAAASRHRFAWRPAGPAEMAELLADLEPIAARHGMLLTWCSQPDLGGRPARCIDVRRLSAVAGRTIAAPQKGNRPGCDCALSRDIGAYDSCPHGCVYCYAVANRAGALARYRRHDPASAGLGPPSRSPT